MLFIFRYTRAKLEASGTTRIPLVILKNIPVGFPPPLSLPLFLPLFLPLVVWGCAWEVEGTRVGEEEAPHPCSLQGILVVVGLSILISYLIRLDDYDVAILGKISDSSFPSPYPPEITSVEDLRKGITPAVAISILGFLGICFSNMFMVSHLDTHPTHPGHPIRINHCSEALCG